MPSLVSEARQVKETPETPAPLRAAALCLRRRRNVILPSEQTGPRVPHTTNAINSESMPPEPMQDTLSLPLWGCCILSRTFFTPWAHPFCIVTPCPDLTCSSRSGEPSLSPKTLCPLSLLPQHRLFTDVSVCERVSHHSRASVGPTPSQTVNSRVTGAHPP